MRLGKAIKSLYPDSEFAIENDDIASIRWFKNQPEGFNFKSRDISFVNSKLKELNDEADRLEAIEESLEYQRKRRIEYPSLAELADALYWQAQGDNTKMDAYLEAVDNVKKKYPKGA